MQRALYDPEQGFYARGGSAGRRGDFVTSPEVGPLFGAVLARALDGWWDELGRPDPYWVIDAGAGPGTLARTVAVAEPRSRRAWRHVTVEVSAPQRDQHPPWVEARSELPDGPVTGVIVANELLDNLPFDLVHGDRPVLVDETGPRLVPEVPIDECTVDAVGARWWLEEALGRLDAGRVLVIDYCTATAEPGRIRTFRDQQRGGHPLAAPGSQDITADVPIDQLAAVSPPAEVTTQAAWLRRWGIDGLVDEGRRAWRDGAAEGTLEAIRGRSRITEAEALLDPAGLGGFSVLAWIVARTEPGA